MSLYPDHDRITLSCSEGMSESDPSSTNTLLPVRSTVRGLNPGCIAGYVIISPIGGSYVDCVPKGFLGAINVSVQTFV